LVAVPRFLESGAPVVLIVVIGELKLTTADGMERQVGEGEHVRLSGEPTAAKTDPEVPQVADVGTKARVPVVRELLERALAQRTAGQVDAAARTYRELIRLHPRSSAARTALVSLGQLELASNPAAALRSFESYLASGKGVLREEASYGRVRALRRLGRNVAERKAIEIYLIDHPDGMYAAQVRSRLAELVKGE
jgi:predicted TPR repeat methyltransferase